MKIGIDAKWYFEGPVSNQVVIRNLVANMAADSRGHELYFFLNKKHRHLPFPFEGNNIHRIDVWAGNNMLSNFFLLPILGKRLGLDGILYQNFGSMFGPPRWLYIHDVLFLEYPAFFSFTERLYLSLIPFLARFSSRIITITRHEQERMQRFSVGAGKKITFFHHGRELDFKPALEQTPAQLKRIREKYQLPEEYLLYTGRINARKNLLILLEAFEECGLKIPMVFVGSKDWKNEPGLEEKIQKLSAEGRLILTGKVPFEDLPLIMCQATVFCFISRAEGFGLPVLEAMASGVPVITSENSAMAEVCGEAAMLVNPNSSESVQIAMRHFFENPELGKKMSDAGIRKSKEYDWKKTAVALLDWLSFSN